MKRMKTVRPGRLAALLLALLTLSCAALAEETPAVADDGPARIELSTQYPALVAKAGGTVAGRMAVLAEGDAKNRDDIKFLAPLPTFKADGSVR